MFQQTYGLAEGNAGDGDYGRRSGHEHAGIFPGSTIHDVAQVVGAGYSMSKETGDVAMIVKPLRVAMLLPVILIITLSYRKHHVAGPSARRCHPWCPGCGSVCAARRQQQRWRDLRRYSAPAPNTLHLVVSMSAIGMKAHLKDFATVGFKLILLMVSETVFLAILVVAFIFLAR